MLSIVLVSAQHITLSGTIKDSNSKDYIPHTSVTLLDANKHILVGTMSNNLGVFEFKKLKQGTYIINVKSIGYTQTDTTITLLNKGKQNIGDIYLHATQHEIYEVSVTA